jgi:hypothetical protein
MPLVPNRPLRRRRSRPRLGFVAVKWSKDKGSNESSGSFAGTARKQAGRRTTTIGSAQRRADVTPWRRTLGGKQHAACSQSSSSSSSFSSSIGIRGGEVVKG